jgi:DsbC/DsbD-like thiol-disulfide interchange protein
MASNNYYWKRLRTLLLPLLCLPCLLAQGNSYLTVGEPSKVTGKRNATVETKIPLSVQPGYHVQSDKPTEEYLIPLKLTWTSPGALQPQRVTYPKPSMEKVGDQSLSVFTGNFDLVVNFKVAPNAQAGPGSAAAKLRYQACNDRACFPPKTLDVTVPYSIQ